jgi:hypothetical protein
MAIRLKDLFILDEANLTGTSRSGGVSNWDHYVARDFSDRKQYSIEKNSKIIDKNTSAELGEVSVGDKVNILSKEVEKIGGSSYAYIRKLSDNTAGYVKLTSISKPTTQSKDSVIPGGGNSKEFLPKKLGLEGIKFKSTSELISATINGISSVYGDSVYAEIKSYLSDILSKLSGTNVSINESFSKNYKLSRRYNISDGDVKILSKNFGEVLGGIYTITHNKKAQYVQFPSDDNQGLFDYLMVDDKDRTTYISVKSAGGSSTSLSNINFVLNNFSNNRIFTNNKNEVETIRSLMNNQKEGKTTLTNIENFYKTVLNTEESQILASINKISKYKAKNLSQSELSLWFQSMKKTSSKEVFINTMKDIYSKVLGGSGASDSSLSEIYDLTSSDPVQNGYLYYPMGSYIVKYLNTNKKYVDILNYILNFASYIHQFDANLSQDSFNIKIHTFDKNEFRFSYNGMAKKPANRPIGFKKI